MWIVLCTYQTVCGLKRWERHIWFREDIPLMLISSGLFILIRFLTVWMICNKFQCFHLLQDFWWFDNVTVIISANTNLECVLYTFQNLCRLCVHKSFFSKNRRQNSGYNLSYKLSRTKLNVYFSGFVSWGWVSLYNSSCTRTCSVVQACLELIEILLSLPS